MTLVVDVKSMSNGVVLEVCNETSDIDGGHYLQG
jgi:hypothetical protein